MSRKIELEESLSALMDNEVDDLELRRVLKALPDNNDLYEKWSNFHLISAVVNQETHLQSSVDLLSGIQAQLEDEDIPVLERRSTSILNNSLFRTISQSAIAASVALAVLFTMNTLNSNNSSNTSVIEMAKLSITEQEGFNTPEFNGEYTASEFSRLASFGSPDSSVEGSEIEHLRQAVYKEFERSNENVVNPLEYTSVNE